MGNNISKKDLFNMFIIYKYNKNECLSINLNALMNILAKYAMNANYKDLFKLIKITIGEKGPKIVDLTNLVDLYVRNKIITTLDEDSNFSIIATEEKIRILKRKYDNIKYSIYYKMIDEINNDLKEKNQCEILYIDEIVNIPKYPILKKKVFKDLH